MVRKDPSTSMSMSIVTKSTASTASSFTTDNASTSTPTSSMPKSTSATSTPTQVSTSATTTPGTTSSSLSTSSIPTTFSSSTILPLLSSSIITTTTTTIPSTTVPSTTISLPSSSILTIASPTSSPPTNITITQAPAENHTAALVGITVGSSIAILLLLAITGTWYAHVRSRTKARREEEHEIATNSQGTFIGGYNLTKLKEQESEQQPTIPKLEKTGEARVEEKIKAAGVRRSNTREDGRRNGVMLQVTNPDPALGIIHSESHQQTFEAGAHNRARFDAWKKSKGIQHHALEAATLYHHSEFSGSKTQPTIPFAQPQQHETDVEIIAEGVKRMRSTLDSWKTGDVEPLIPEVKITAATPVLENAGFEKGMGEGRELRTFLLSGDKAVVKGPATFEDMGLKQGRKGLSIYGAPRSVVDK